MFFKSMSSSLDRDHCHPTWKLTCGSERIRHRPALSSFWEMYFLTRVFHYGGYVEARVKKLQRSGPEVIRRDVALPIGR